MSQTDILQYYNDLAKNYDADRFGNSYGDFIDIQERKLLKIILKHTTGYIADLGCGTGRLMEFATTGVDGSEEMLKIAQQKFPQKTFSCADIATLPFENNSLNTVFSFHVFMHLDKEKASSVFNETYRVLKPGGLLIFDFPSVKRRKVFNAGTSGWHGNTAYDINSLKQQLADNFIYRQHYGILLLPIHRLPKRVRKYFIGLDSFLCRLFKSYASYNVAVFVKKDRSKKSVFFAPL